jgi:proteasome lid subunit RPN8/RPN11
MGEDLRISRQMLDRITAETGANPYVEVCGLLLGQADGITTIQPCRNVAAEPATRFEIDPVALLAAHRSARTGGPALIGCYHSHPTGRAEPSPRDAADAAPDGSIWLIAAGNVVTAWRATPNGAWHGRFDPVPLVSTEP